MTPRREMWQAGRGFRLKLLVGMMIVVAGITALSLYIAQRTSVTDAERDLQRDFESELASLHRAHEMRQSALAERCRALVEKPRIHAALEDNALDLLYPSAKDELRDVMGSDDQAKNNEGLHGTFYRFLDAKGEVITPPSSAAVGELSADEEAALTLQSVPSREQIGYLPRNTGDRGEGSVDQVIAMPIVSTETGEVIAALVVGFRNGEPAPERIARGVRSGIWVNGNLHVPALHYTALTSIEAEAARAVAAKPDSGVSYAIRVGGQPHLLFCRRLNPGSLFPPAYEVSIYPLTESIARQRSIRWKILGAGALVMLAGFGASHLLAGRLSVPVERLAVDSAEHRAQREKAEAALALTNKELQRSMRFSADASHQLKTPVTVLRAGLEELLARDDLSPEVRDELSSLVHQTFRLGGVIDDLLLLSRMDAGRLKLDLQPVNLCQLIEGWLDDFSALPDELDLDVQMQCPEGLQIEGEKRYTSLIVQNLLENARKYNRPHGWIRVVVSADDPWVIVRVANSGEPISAAGREHIFERFHRGVIGENVPGHGLGLNLARELARLHRGELRLVKSDDEGTVFEVRFRLAKESASSSYRTL